MSNLPTRSTWQPLDNLTEKQYYFNTKGVKSMEKFKVALLQLISEEKPDDNLDKGISYCKTAKDFV